MKNKLLRKISYMGLLTVLATPVAMGMDESLAADRTAMGCIGEVEMKTPTRQVMTRGAESAADFEFDSEKLGRLKADFNANDPKAKNNAASPGRPVKELDVDTKNPQKGTFADYCKSWVESTITKFRTVAEFLRLKREFWKGRYEDTWKTSSVLVNYLYSSLQYLREENETLKAQNARLERELAQARGENTGLKLRSAAPSQVGARTNASNVSGISPAISSTFVPEGRRRLATAKHEVE